MRRRARGSNYRTPPPAGDVEKDTGTAASGLARMRSIAAGEHVVGGR
jgi:hypothetical protein